MEPVSMIIAALGAGAIAATKDTAGTVVKDAYQGLKTLIKKKFEGDVLGQAMVDAKPEEIKQAEGLLKDKITKAAADQDQEIIKLAQDLLDKIKEQPGGQEIINQTQTNTMSGNTIGGNVNFAPVQEG
jgi:cell division septum initiation protein DivIVA